MWLASFKPEFDCGELACLLAKSNNMLKIYQGLKDPPFKRVFNSTFVIMIRFFSSSHWLCEAEYFIQWVWLKVLEMFVRIYEALLKWTHDLHVLKAAKVWAVFMHLGNGLFTWYCCTAPGPPRGWDGRGNCE